MSYRLLKSITYLKEIIKSIQNNEIKSEIEVGYT